MHKIKEMLMKELYEYEEKAKKMNGGKLSAGDLETIHKLTDTVKNIDKIEMLENEDNEYSEAGNWMADGRMYDTYSVYTAKQLPPLSIYYMSDVPCTNGKHQY